jgi:hypothetical protein
MKSAQAVSVGAVGAASTTSARSLGIAAAGLAGPVFVASVAVQAALHEDFSMVDHPLSVLALGTNGWVQVVSFVAAGVAFMAGGIHASRKASRTPGASVWGPRSVVLLGLGFVLAGIFQSDPVDGYPAGSVAPETMSWHGGIHAGAAALSGLAAIAAAIVYARWFRRNGHSTWFKASVLVAVISFIVSSAGSGSGNFLVAFVAGALSWIWASVLIARSPASDA